MLKNLFDVSANGKKVFDIRTSIVTLRYILWLSENIRKEKKTFFRFYLFVLSSSRHKTNGWKWIRSESRKKKSFSFAHRWTIFDEFSLCKYFQMKMNFSSFVRSSLTSVTWQRDKYFNPLFNCFQSEIFIKQKKRSICISFSKWIEFLPQLKHKKRTKNGRNRTIKLHAIFDWKFSIHSNS